jgi:hypothetical protein
MLLSFATTHYETFSLNLLEFYLNEFDVLLPVYCTLISEKEDADLITFIQRSKQ